MCHILQISNRVFIFIQKAIILDNKEFLAYLSLVEYYTKTNQLFKAGRLAFKIKNEHPDLLIVSFLLGLVYFPPGTKMFQFPGFALSLLIDSVRS